MVVLVFLTILLNVDKVVGVIGSITPFLIISVIGVSVYCLATMGDATFTALDSSRN